MLKDFPQAGCMLHTYRPQEVSRCLADRRVVFVGGATTRHLFESLCKKVDSKYETPHLGAEAHQVVNLSSVRFEFVWDPTLDSPELKHIRDGYDDENARPALTVIGSGHDYIRQESDVTLWAAHLGALVSGFDGTQSEKLRRSDSLVFIPALDPNTTQMVESDRALITPEKVDNMNDVLDSLTQQYRIDTAFTFNHIARGPEALIDGLNPSPQAASVMADVLLNLRCNEESLPKKYPFASTCCNQYPRINWVQMAGFTFAALLIPIAIYLIHQGSNLGSSAFLRAMPSSKYQLSILTMGLVVILCWYCDRTNIFDKEQKQTEASQFFIGMGILILASLYTLQTSDKDLAFLNRDQTDEWKGWMQVAILVYHYVGVSKTEYIYNYMRVCPTSYLFMTGFGHTVYFLKKDDFSFKRVVATMLRLNLLNVILAYAMGNDWLLYYFAPLVTWNFFVIWLCLWAGHQHNKNLPFLYGKMAAFALANSAFYHVPGILEGMWYFFQTVFHMQGDLREWRFRITLDQYSIFPGMICAVLFINWNKLSVPQSPHWPSIQKLIYTVATGIMLYYAYFEATMPTKMMYNAWHPYTAWLPCISFVILRNSTSYLRRTHNGFFAWVGRGSLETFLLQFHIWLAADTAGLLVIPGLAHQRALNALITTPMFFWVSQLATNATGDCIAWIMAADQAVQRPTLPMSIKSNPKGLPTLGMIGNANPRVPSVNGHANGAPHANANGHATPAKDPEKMHAVDLDGDGGMGEGSLLGKAVDLVQKDLRVRVGLLLFAMAFANWVSCFMYETMKLSTANPSPDLLYLSQRSTSSMTRTSFYSKPASIRRWRHLRIRNSSSSGSELIICYLASSQTGSCFDPWVGQDEQEPRQARATGLDDAPTPESVDRRSPRVETHTRPIKHQPYLYSLMIILLPARPP